MASDAGRADGLSSCLTGRTVLILGTGGVALFGAQLAKAAGAQVALVSRSTEKLDRLRRLPLAVDAMISSDATAQWEDRVLDLTGQAGADFVLETVGRDTLAHSLAAAALNGHVALIGEPSGFVDTLDIQQIRGKLLTIQGVSATNRAKLEDLVKFIVEHDIHPVIDQVFTFSQAPQAFDYVRTARHIGKVTIMFPK
jgi:NADPH:quinone reductase-like Zn-dependent oxidoreductase